VLYNTYYRINGILMFTKATPAALRVRLTEEVGRGGEEGTYKMPFVPPMILAAMEASLPLLEH